HVLFGYARGDYASHRTVMRFVAGSEKPGDVAADWALLVLTPDSQAPAVRPLRLAEAPAMPGEVVAMAGYSRDRRHVLLADRACHVIATGALIRHDCTGTFGTSGAPLLMPRGAVWEIAGITAALAPDGTKLAVPAGAVRGALSELLKR